MDNTIQGCANTIQGENYAYTRTIETTIPSPQVNVAPPPYPNGRQINIEPINFGYIVKVGCQNFAIETKEKLTKFLAIYLADPTGTEEKWFKKELDLNS